VVWGQALAALRDHAGALEKYEAALALDPEQPELNDLVTVSLRSLGAQASAVVKGWQARIDRLDRADIFLSWGQVLDELDERAAALVQYERAAAKRPHDVEALHRLGDALVARGRHDEALSPYTQAAAKTGGENLGRLGRALVHVDAEDEAVTTFQRTVDAIDGARAYWQWGKVLAALGRPAEALAHYEKCASKGFGGHALEVDIGITLADLGRCAEAVAHYQRALPKSPWPSDVQNFLGNAYLAERDFERALRHYREAARTSHLAAVFNWALALGQLRRVEESNAQYQSLIRTCEEILGRGEGDVYNAKFFLPFARHNLANSWHQHGEYAASRPAWEAAASAYRQYNDEIADPDHFMYAADLLREIHQDYAGADQFLRRGLAINPKHTGLLAGLVKVCLARRDEAPSATDPDARGRTHRDAWDAYWKAERILNGRIARTETGALLLELGQLHASVGENGKALAALQKAVAKSPDVPDGYYELGVVCMRMDDAKTALGHFKAALERAPGNLGIWSNLAEAYLKTGQPERAEAEYKKILDISPAHADSLLGLGQVYSTMGEAQMSRDNKADAEAMFIRSSEQLAKAIRLHEQDVASRRLGEAELAAARYSCGYAHVMRYETQSLVKKDESLLQEGRRTFDRIPVGDVNYHKARRAIGKIDERLTPPGLLAEQWGARMVLAAAVVMFLIGLGALVIGRPVWAGGFLITEPALAELKRRGASDDLVKKLRPLEGRYLSDQGHLTEELRKAGGEEAAAKFGVQLATASAVGTAIQGWRPVETGYAVLLMFGSIIFMVAGLYLQQISKLKFGGLELEKSSGDQTRVATSLGISK
jgi:tetratricopeptide (TPR) repeat protein